MNDERLETYLIIIDWGETCSVRVLKGDGRQIHWHGLDGSRWTNWLQTDNAFHCYRKIDVLRDALGPEELGEWYEFPIGGETAVPFKAWQYTETGGGVQEC